MPHEGCVKRLPPFFQTAFLDQVCTRGGQAILRTTARPRDFVSRENEETMTLQELRTTKRDEILLIAARRGARNVRVFGPVARGDDDERSDIDFLVDLEPDRSLFDRSGLLIDLEAEVIPYGQETATLQD